MRVGDQPQERGPRCPTEHPQPVHPVGVFVRMGPPGHDGGGPLVARGLDLGDHGGVVVAGGVAEPVHGDVEAALDRAPRVRDLFAQRAGAQGDQVGVADPLRVELPARGDQPADLALAETSLRGREPASWMFSSAGQPSLRSTGSARVYCDW